MSTAPAGYVAVARLTELDPTVPHAVALPDGRRLCLVRDGAAVYAVDDQCTHRDFALSGGDVVSPCVLECPWHGARYDVRSGAPLGGPGLDPLGTHAVHIDGERVLIGPRLTESPSA